MKTLKQVKRIIQSNKKILENDYGVSHLGLFGSYVRGQANEGSDIDILVEFDSSIDLIKFIQLKNYLSDLLDEKVDLVMKKSLKPAIGTRVLEEVIEV